MSGCAACCVAVLISAAVPGGPSPVGQATPERTAVRRLVLCTTLPIHAFASRVAEGVEGTAIELLLDPDVGCPHDYALSPRDRKRIADSSLILANGLGLDSFLPRTAPGLPPIVEVTAGCALLRGASCVGHDHSDHGHDGHEAAANPHVWLSPREAVRVTRNIADALEKLDPENKAHYQAQARAFGEKLEALAKDIASVAETIRGPRVAAPIGVFDYLARDLGLKVVASLDSHSSEGSSPRAISDAIRAIEQQRASVVLSEEGLQNRVAETVSRNAKVPCVALDSLTRSDRFPTPADWYETRMRANVTAIRQAFDRK